MDFMVVWRSFATTAGSLDTGWGDCAPACPTAINNEPAAVKATTALRTAFRGTRLRDLYPFKFMKWLTQLSPRQMVWKLDAQAAIAIPLLQSITYFEKRPPLSPAWLLPGARSQVSPGL